MGQDKSKWSEAAKDRAFQRLLVTQKTPVSYARKKAIMDAIPDTLPRY
jgi:hypothetical protein